MVGKEGGVMTAAAATDGAAILRAILDDPADDLPRLAYADWCDENGRAERAEFVRLQIGRERDPDWHGFLCLPERPCRNCRRERHLFAVPADAAMFAGGPLWGGWQPRPVSGRSPLTLHFGEPLSDPPAFLFTFRRGFVAAVNCPLDAWLAHGPAVVRAHPVTALRITDRVPWNPAPGEAYWFPDLPNGFPAAALPAVVLAALRDDETRASVVDGSKMYRSPKLALDALNAAALLWAKKKGA